MDIGRLCSTQGGEEQATHQRISEYVKVICDRYQGMGFTPREEWVVEQTIHGLRRLLADIQCSQAGRNAVDAFLTLAAEELPGTP